MQFNAIPLYVLYRYSLNVAEYIKLTHASLVVMYNFKVLMALQ
jgi:hypothetical protein